MFRRVDSLNYAVHSADGPKLSQAIESEGHAILRSAFGPQEVATLRSELERIYADSEPEMRSSAINRRVGDMFRYGVFNQSAAVQQAISSRSILDVVEPLLGSDCHVIACTSWDNPPGRSLTPHGLGWHIDGGPQVPRHGGTLWPRDIAYPIFIISSHIYLADVGSNDGPTACIPRSHTSGQTPPFDRIADDDLSFEGHQPVKHVVKAGDVDFRVSDIWHRRWPPSEISGRRIFIQTTYARRDIAQRIVRCEDLNHASPEALARCRSRRERILLGEHPESYFDA